MIDYLDHSVVIEEEYDTPLLGQSGTHQAFQQHPEVDVAQSFTARHGLAGNLSYPCTCWDELPLRLERFPLGQPTDWVALGSEVELARIGFSYDELAKEGEAPAMTYEDFVSMLTISRVEMARAPTSVDHVVGTSRDSSRYKKGQMIALKGAIFRDLLHLISMVVMMLFESGYIFRYARLNKSFVLEYRLHDMTPCPASRVYEAL
ncbi:conserved hypothetical protein [Ricinus communis]|uniref:Uncharacterized protein n=1 Tax=Ricinus communis TaxID=3988 RepID=B9T8N5_RICCO|nr:conserved hypothetical protein [Ricinus communis]